MAYQRDDMRTMARDFLYESTADLVTDARINTSIDHTLRELPRKGIYREEIDTFTLVLDQIDYALDSDVLKLEKVQINAGTATKPDWVDLKGWDIYGGALYLRSRPSKAYTGRLHSKKTFTLVSDDSTDYDFSEDIAELVAMGAALRCFTFLMGYFMKASNWDAIGKPDRSMLGALIRWRDDLEQRYKDLIRAFRSTPRPREINLVD